MITIRRTNKRLPVKWLMCKSCTPATRISTDNTFDIIVSDLSIDEKQVLIMKLFNDNPYLAWCGNLDNPEFRTCKPVTDFYSINSLVIKGNKMYTSYETISDIRRYSVYEYYKAIDYYEFIETTEDDKNNENIHNTE